MKKTEFEYLIDSNPEVARIELESQGLILRVVKVDGNWKEINADARSNRVNVEVVDGSISAIESIG